MTRGDQDGAGCPRGVPRRHRHGTRRQFVFLRGTAGRPRTDGGAAAQSVGGSSNKRVKLSTKSRAVDGRTRCGQNKTDCGDAGSLAHEYRVRRPAGWPAHAILRFGRSCKLFTSAAQLYLLGVVVQCGQDAISRATDEPPPATGVREQNHLALLLVK